MFTNVITDISASPPSSLTCLLSQWLVRVDERLVVNRFEPEMRKIFVVRNNKTMSCMPVEYLLYVAYFVVKNKTHIVRGYIRMVELNV